MWKTAGQPSSNPWGLEGKKAGHKVQQLVSIAMASSTALRKLAAECPKLATRSFHASRSAAADYEHAPKMYNLLEMKNRKLKFGVLAVGMIVGGFGIPTVAAVWQQKKASG